MFKKKIDKHLTKVTQLEYFNPALNIMHFYASFSILHGIASSSSQFQLEGRMWEEAST